MCYCECDDCDKIDDEKVSLSEIVTLLDRVKLLEIDLYNLRFVLDRKGVT